MVQLPQSIHDQVTNVGTGYLAFAYLVKLSLDGVRKLVNGASGKRPFLAGLANTQQKLIPTEFFTAAILLNNEDIVRLYVLVSGEASIAGEAFPSPSYPLIKTPRIYYLRFLPAAVRTVHIPLPALVV
jgi:hypothetical protein